jgi:hypothetical protein
MKNTTATAQTTTYVAPAREVKAGDVIAEADGFMWTVTAIGYHNGRVILSLVPSFPSMTAGPHDLKLKACRNVRIVKELN